MINILYILLAVLILLFMVVIHEAGHYFAAKILKFNINEFSIGFGPKLISKQLKNGELFSLRAIPLGGYCAFLGEDEPAAPGNKNLVPEKPIAGQSNTNGADEKPIAANDSKITLQVAENAAGSSAKKRTFYDEKPWKRIIVLAAGGIFNFISAFIFTFILLIVVGVQTPYVSTVYEKPYTGGETVYYNELKKDDKILKVNGSALSVLNTYEEALQKVKDGEPLVLTVLRDGQELDITLEKQTIVTTDENGKTEEYQGYGFVLKRKSESLGFGGALYYTVPYTGKLSWSILGTFGKLVTGKLAITSLSGPVGTIGQMAGYAAIDWRYILVLLPLIASNLAIFNLLPIPALDGSKIVFTVIEWIRGKPVNRNVESMIHFVGMAALLLFVVVVDIIGFIL